MVPVLINKPDLTIITPSPAAMNAYFNFVIPAATVASIVITPVVDTTVMVDNLPVITMLTIVIVGANGQTPYSDTITLRGQSTFTTANNQGIILQGQIGNGVAGSTVTVTNCGQTSVMAE